LPTKRKDTTNTEEPFAEGTLFSSTRGKKKKEKRRRGKSLYFLLKSDREPIGGKGRHQRSVPSLCERGEKGGEEEGEQGAQECSFNSSLIMGRKKKRRKKKEGGKENARASLLEPARAWAPYAKEEGEKKGKKYNKTSPRPFTTKDNSVSKKERGEGREERGLPESCPGALACNGGFQREEEKKGGKEGDFKEEGSRLTWKRWFLSLCRKEGGKKRRRKIPPPPPGKGLCEFRGNERP